MNVELRQAASPADWSAARSLVREYSRSLGVDLCFQDLEAELAGLESMYAPPAGAFLLASADGALIGCGALRRLDERTGEMKRVYVAPGGRGRGAGRRIVEALLARARQAGYGRVVLDTLPSMVEARGLYDSLGFRPTSAYCFNPVPGAAYLELRLR